MNFPSTRPVRRLYCATAAVGPDPLAFRALVCGGDSASDYGRTQLDSCELFDLHQGGSFVNCAPLPQPSSKIVAVQLSGGDVLVSAPNSAEWLRYDQRIDAWQQLGNAPDQPEKLRHFAAVRISEHLVTVLGGSHEAAAGASV